MGKIKPKQISLYTDPSFLVSSDNLIPSQKSIKDFVNQKILNNPDWNNPDIDKAPSVSAVKSEIDAIVSFSQYDQVLLAGQSSFIVTHNLNNLYIIGEVYTAGTNGLGNPIPSERIFPVITIVDINTIRVDFNSVTSVDYVVVVLSRSLIGLNNGTSGTSSNTLEHISVNTYSELTSKKNSNNLIPGLFYELTDYSTKHIIPYTNSLNTGSTEPLILLATSSNTFSNNAYSINFPQDIIKYDFDNNLCEDSTPRNGFITYRKDITNVLETEYDFRTVKFRRFEVDTNVIAWNSTSSYSANDLVWYNDILYISTINNNINISFNSTGWNSLLSTTGYFGKNLIFDELSPIVLGTTVLTSSGIFQDYLTFGTNCENISIKKYSTLNNIVLGDNSYNIEFNFNNNDNNVGSNSNNIFFGSDSNSNILGNNSTYQIYEKNSINLCIGDASNCINVGISVNNIFIGRQASTLSIGSLCGYINIGNNCNNIYIGGNSAFLVVNNNSHSIYLPFSFTNKIFGTVSGIKIFISDTNVKTYTIAGINNIVVNMQSPDNELWYLTIENDGNISSNKLI